MQRPRIKNKRILLERIEKFISPLYFADVNLHSKLYKDTFKVQSVSHYHAPDRISYSEATADKGLYQEVLVGKEFGPTWSSHWFRLDIDLSLNKNWINQEVRLRWNSSSEAMVWLDGRPMQGFTGGDGQVRTDFILTKNCQGDEKFPLYVEMAANGMFGAGNNGMINPPNPLSQFALKMVEVAVLDNDVYGIIRDLKLLIEINQNFPEEEDLGHHALQVGCDVVNCFQPENRTSIKRAKALLDDFFVNKEGGDNDKRFTVHAMGHCHIDTAWLWPYAETKRKCGRSWSSTVGLMKRYPQFTFACSQAVQFEWVKERYPSLYEEMLKHYKQKQFLPTGGTWVEMDGNIPSGESFVRQFLYGQRFFEKEFGSCDVFWLPDTFGYSAQLPQICKEAGIKYFLTQKISWSLVNKFPHNSFLWQGIDGTKVLTHFPPADTYESSVSVKDILKTRSQNREQGIVRDGVLLYGFGDGGGGPTEDMIENIERMKNVPGCPRIIHSSPKTFFQKLDGSKQLLQTWVGELYLELHQGTFTTQALIKKRNRKCEFMLKTSELLHVLATLKELEAKPTESKVCEKCELEIVWKKLLLNQFHDVLPGTSIKLVTDDAEAIYQEIISACTDMDCKHKQVVFGQVEQGETVLLNTTSFPRQEVLDFGGEKHMVQVPAMGCAFLNHAIISNVKSEARLEIGVEGGITLSNDQLSATFNSLGQLVHFQLLSNSRECVAKDKTCNTFVLTSDIPLFWDAWDVMPYNEETWQILTGGKIEVIEKGPLRASFKVTIDISEQSWIKQTISLDACSKYLRFDTEVEWHENRKMLKVVFPFNVHADEATYEIQCGHLRRPTHANTSWDWAKYEVCAHKWMDISEYDFGVALLNDCKYGFSTYQNTVQMSLLRSSKAPDDQADMGTHHFSYALMPHTGTFQTANVIANGYCFNSPIEVISHVDKETFGKTGKSFFAVDNPAVVIQSIKMNDENEDEVVVRMYESFGGQAHTMLRTYKPFDGVYRVNLCEKKDSTNDDGHNLIKQLNESEVQFLLNPFEIMTLSFKMRL